jgi:cobalt-zinc-cadmium efflux system protein
MHAHTDQRRALTFALVANGAFLVCELVGGLAFHSLALLADGVHMVSDVAALSIALIAQRLGTCGATARQPYGLQRAEVLGAQANAVLLFAASGWLALSAVRRLSDPVAIAGRGVLLVASAGLVVNIVSAVVLQRSAGHNLNMRGAVLHMTFDAAGSVAVIAAAIAALAWDAAWVDPAASLAIVLLVLLGAWRLLRDAMLVLMEGSPRHLDAREIEAFIASDPVVEDVHHVHVWTLASDVPALSAHVVISGERTLHDAQVEGNRIRSLVHDRFGIEHTTFELECHACDDG